MFAVASAVVWGAGAVPVTGDQAKLAVGNWLADEASPMAVRFSRPSQEAETVCDANGKALFHVVKMEGGGYVATPTDTRINPIVVFSGSGELDLGEGSPLRKVLEADMARRLEAVSQRGTAKGASGASKAEKAWANLLAHRNGRTRAIADESQLSEVRVSPLVKTKWDQKTWNDERAGSPAVYSRYTPYGWVCGCVATAGAQIMKYYDWPTKEMPAAWFVVQTNDQYFVRRRTAGCYAWSEMPLSRAVRADISESECNAIGKLTSDVGLAVNMNYKRFFDPEHNRWVEDSSAYTANLTVALTREFDYASGKVYWPEVGNGSIRTGALLGEQMEGAILASIDAGMPVSAAIHGDEGGHSVVIDGYGYKNGIRYMHINMGWSGAEDIWYDVMGEKLSETYQFERLKAVGYNIHPTAHDPK